MHEPLAAPTPRLVTEQVAVAYDSETLAIRSLSLTIFPGERIAMLGANGSGKTTSLLTLAGLLRLRAGRLLLNGEAYDDTSAQRRRWRMHLGLVLADPDDQLIAPIVRDDVAYGVRNAGLAESVVTERVDEVLEQLGIESLRARSVHTLSLGERKRVAIAGVLALQPTVLLLDEPTANLDRCARTGLRQVLDVAAGSARTVCIATHDTRFALSWATRVVVLELGGVIADGPPSAVLADRALLDRAWLDDPRS